MTGIGTQTFSDISSKEEGRWEKGDTSKCREWKKRWPLAVKGAQGGAKVKVVPGRQDVRRKSVLSRAEVLCTGFHPSVNNVY